MQGQTDDGFTLIELLIVIVILGILSTIVVFAVRGVTADADLSACAAEARTLETAVEAYFASRPAIAIPQTGATADGYEITLVDYGLLRSPSVWFDLVDGDGALQLATGSPCIL